MKELTGVEFYELLPEYFDMDPQAAWRDFRGKYGQNIIQGRTASDREEAFKFMLDRYQKYPAERVLQLRQARIQAFQSDVAEAFMSTPDIGEPDIEDWAGAVAKLKNYSRSVVEALELLAEKKPDEAAKLKDRAAVLWPDLFEEPSE